MLQYTVSYATLVAGRNTFSAKTVVFVLKNIISSASSALAEAIASFLSRLVYLANVRFHWVIDAAE